MGGGHSICVPGYSVRLEFADMLRFGHGENRYPADLSENKISKVRQAGLKRLLADSYGRRLLGWGVLGAPQRIILRHGNSVLRSLIGR